MSGNLLNIKDSYSNFFVYPEKFNFLVNEKKINKDDKLKDKSIK